MKISNVTVGATFYATHQVDIVIDDKAFNKFHAWNIEETEADNEWIKESGGNLKPMPTKEQTLEILLEDATAYYDNEFKDLQFQFGNEIGLKAEIDLGNGHEAEIKQIIKSSIYRSGEYEPINGEVEIFVGHMEIIEKEDEG